MLAEDLEQVSTCRRLQQEVQELLALVRAVQANDEGRAQHHVDLLLAHRHGLQPLLHAEALRQGLHGIAPARRRVLLQGHVPEAAGTQHPEAPQPLARHARALSGVRLEPLEGRQALALPDGHHVPQCGIAPLGALPIVHVLAAREHLRDAHLGQDLERLPLDRQQRGSVAGHEEAVRLRLVLCGHLLQAKQISSAQNLRLFTIYVEPEHTLEYDVELLDDLPRCNQLLPALTKQLL
mmetsp:Transcript_163208/g.523499  ORF Transcript_163208/g.523499 Transcript_163208/m.523499 type:complete len:237 (+) Transcript_163208:787-1497(+)